MQSINLYLPEYRPKRELLSLRHSAILFAVFIALLIGMQVNKGHQLQQLNQAVAALQQQETGIKQDIDELKKKASNSDKHRLQKQAQELRVAIANRNAIKKAMSGNSMGNQRGFSEHLYVLGEKRTEDLVVRRFVLSRGGEYIELEGTTGRPSSVPLYVYRLQQSPVFVDAKFGSLTISDAGGLAHFRLSGGGARPAKPGEALDVLIDSELRK